jgi:excisionase family DNA binding protein
MREKDLTVEELAAEIGLHYETCLRLLRSGDIPGYKAGPKIWRIPRKGLEEWKARGGAKPQGRPRVRPVKKAEPTTKQQTPMHGEGAEKDK